MSQIEVNSIYNICIVCVVVGGGGVNLLTINDCCMHSSHETFNFIMSLLAMLKGT